MIEIQYITFLVILFFAIIFNFTIVNFRLFKAKNTPFQIQDIHVGSPSRLGGIIIYLIFFGYDFLFSDFSYLIFFCSLIFIIPALLEDVRINVKPSIRLFLILCSSLIIVSQLPSLPKFDFGSLNVIFNNYSFQVIFFTLAISTVINGQNIVDGTNGLSALTALSIFSSLLFLGFYLNDKNLINESLIMITLLIGFLLFNYPFGNIFLGDTGSYFLGFFSCYTIIKVFAEYPDLPSWCAVSILFYPTLEVIFSYFRKIFQKQSPFLADKKHLHLKIYFLISNGDTSPKLANALVAPFLSIVWLTPLALLPFSLEQPIWSISILIILIFVYLFLYYAIPDPE